MVVMRVTVAALLFARAALAFQPRVRFALRRAVPAMGWADPNWNWGSAIGEAHDLAQPLRARLNADAAAREAWIKRLAAGEVDIEEAKLALGLRAQKARRQRVDGDGLGWRLMEDLAACKFEGRDDLLAEDCERLIAALPPVEFAVALFFRTEEAAKGPPAANAIARALVGMRFLEDGL